MKKLFLLLVLGYMLAQNISGQSVAINTTGNPAHPSALLDVSINNKGVMIPRMTLSERNAIPSPGNSLLVFVTDSVMRGYHYYDSLTTSWVRIGDSNNSGSYQCKTIIPKPIFSEESVAPIIHSNNTLASLGKVVVPLKISVNKISVASFGTVSTPGKAKIALYSEDGSSKLFEVTTDTIFQSQNTITVTLANICVVNPGVYYVAILSLDNASLDLLTYRRIANSYPLLVVTTTDPIQGKLSVPTNNLPTTINPSSIIYEESRCLYLRLDN